ncbi:MAG TPA: SDR family oxidoreductase [Rubrivivax sp.]|nr:SDR family oxidoreductase [Rubrivivax sp.]HPP82061.1 SDR family oxidoreductase [Rubrivivax sp.]
MHEVIVTGSSSGIGAAVVQSQARLGRRTLGVAHEAAPIVADLGTAAGRDAAVRAVLEHSGAVVDALVCSAGLPPTADPAQIVSVNYFGAIGVLDGLFDALRAGTQPAAVLIASTGAVQVPDPAAHPLTVAILSGDEAAARAEAAKVDHPLTAYCLSKYTLVRAMRNRAVRWAAAGVRLNAAAPGPIATPMLAALHADERLPEQARQFMPPLGRCGEPADVAELVDFLLSPRAAFIHGTVIFIDGGIDALVRPGSF